MEINISKTNKELENILALRYLVNMEELGKSFLFYDDDSIDKSSTQLYAQRNDNAIGSLRCHFKYFDENIHDYWGLEKPHFNSKVALVDRLVIHPSYRKTRVAYDLCTHIYKQALLEGCHLALIETEKHLIKMYEKIGFQVYREVFHKYGIRFQLFINPWDAAYLKEIKSPFYPQFLAYIQMVNAFTTSTSLKEVA
jgi:predicted GNAT family N-acyltransferase